MVAYFGQDPVKAKSFPGRYLQIWNKLEKNCPEEIPIEDMDSLRLLVKFGAMPFEKKQEATGDTYWRALELIQTEKVSALLTKVSFLIWRGYVIS